MMGLCNQYFCVTIQILPLILCQLFDKANQRPQSKSHQVRYRSGDRIVKVTSAIDESPADYQCTISILC